MRAIGFAALLIITVCWLASASGGDEYFDVYLQEKGFEARIDNEVLYVYGNANNATEYSFQVSNILEHLAVFTEQQGFNAQDLNFTEIVYFASPVATTSEIDWQFGLRVDTSALQSYVDNRLYGMKLQLVDTLMDNYTFNPEAVIQPWVQTAPPVPDQALLLFRESQNR